MTGYIAELVAQNGSLDDAWPDAPLGPAPPGTFDPDATAADLEPDDGSFHIAVLTAAELAALPEPDTSDALLGPILVRRYRTVLGAHSGEGKTTFTLRIVRAFLGGETFLGWHGRGEGRVLILDLEQGLRSIKRRLREAGLDTCDRIDYARVPDGLVLDKSERERAAVEKLLEDGNYSVVVIDPLYKAHGGESNDDRQMLALLRVLDEWRERFGFALILPVHCRKPSPGVKFSMHDLFGSSVITRGAEIVLGLARVEDGYSRLHFFKDRDGDLPIGRSWGLLFDPDDGYRRDPKDDEEPRDLEHDVLAHLAHRPGWHTAREIAAKKDDGGIGAGRERVLAALEALRTAGAVEYAKGPEGRNVNAGCYRLIEVARPSKPPEPPAAAQGSQEGRWLGGLAGSIEPGHPEATSRPPGGYWPEPPGHPEPPADEADLDEADRIHAKHHDLTED